MKADVTFHHDENLKLLLRIQKHVSGPEKERCNPKEKQNPL